MGTASVIKLFVVHGWTYDLGKWTEQCAALHERGIEAVLLKVPGLTAPSDQVWTIDGYVQWLHEQLANEKSPIVLGHSNGGRIALKYLAKYPSGFRRLILLDSAGVPVQSAVKKLKLKFVLVVSKVASPLKAIKPLKKVVYKLLKAQDYDNAPEHMKRTMSNMLAADKTIDFASIAVPVDIIWGSNDTVTPLWMGRYIQSHIAGATLQIVDGARHAPQATHVEQVADMLAKIVKAEN